MNIEKKKTIKRKKINRKTDNTLQKDTDTGQPSIGGMTTDPAVILDTQTPRIMGATTLQDIKEEDDSEFTQEITSSTDGQPWAQQQEPGQIQVLDLLLDTKDRVTVFEHEISTTEVAESSQDQDLLQPTTEGTRDQDLPLPHLVNSAEQQMSVTGEEALLPPLPDFNVNSNIFLKEENAALDQSIGEEPEESVSTEERNEDGSDSQRTEHTVNTSTPFSDPGATGSRIVSARTVSMDSVGTDSVLSSTIEPSSELNTSFDLSKALEIPNDSTNNSVSYSSTNATSVSPIITSPKISLKKKFSNSILPGVNSISSPQDSFSQTAAPINQPGGLQSQDLPQHRSVTRSNSTTTTISSGRNSRSNSNTHILLPTLNTAIEGSSLTTLEHNDNGSTIKRSMRKFSIGSTNSSSPSVHSNFEESIYKTPPLASNTKHSHNDLNTVANGISTDANHFQKKKLPLLKRASSAILRKASLSKTNDLGLSSSTSSSATTTPELRSTASFATLGAVFSNGSDGMIQQSSFNRNKKKLSIRAVSSPMESTAGLNYVTSLSPMSSPKVQAVQPSFGNKVKRGFTRIITRSSSNKIDSPQGFYGNTFEHNAADASIPSSTFEIQTSGATDSVREPAAQEQFEGSGSQQTTSDYFSLPKRSLSAKRNSSNNSSSTPTPKCVKNPLVQRSHSIKSNKHSFNGRSNSTSSTNIIRSNSLMGIKGKYANGLGGVGSTRDDCGDQFNEEDITVDIDEITNTLPAITITEKFGAKNTTPIQTQSNIFLDRAYRERPKALDTNAGDGGLNIERPTKMSLKEYVDVLVKQQRVEDERFAILERNFSESGWCSQGDLISLKQKRIVINKKWAERISFYQGKLDA